MNRLWQIRSALPVLLTLVGFAVVLALTSPHPSAPLQLESAAKTVTQSAPQLEASPRPQITVNGQPVALGAEGSTTVPLPSGQARVESAGGVTTVTTSGGTDSSTAISGQGNLNVHVQSDVHGSNSSSTTQLESSSSGLGWSSSSTSSTQTVFGTGQGMVRIDQP